MTTTLTSKGQVTIPKHIRDALLLHPDTDVEFRVNTIGEVVLQPAAQKKRNAVPDRIDRVHGSATVKWCTDDLMRLLRGAD